MYQRLYMLASLYISLQIKNFTTTPSSQNTIFLIFSLPSQHPQKRYKSYPHRPSPRIASLGMLSESAYRTHALMHTQVATFGVSCGSVCPESVGGEPW